MIERATGGDIPESAQWPETTVAIGVVIGIGIGIMPSVAGSGAKSIVDIET